ncbi:hypothetical protein [Microbacterium sp. ZW T5_56]|uniref:hypothetical protein n=1 Tax=Microbacterium sp. ZW T5_56 TaxID=3378081 RepID=UPI00385495DE
MPHLLPFDYVSDAIEHLASQQVYVDDGVPGWQALQASLEQQVAGTDIAVVVYPESVSGLVGRSSDMLDRIASRDDHDTLIVAVGNDLAATSDVVPATDALRIANEQDQQGPMTESLPATIQGIVALTPSGAEDTGGGGLVAGITVGAVALVLAVTVPIVIARRRRKAKAKAKPTALPGPILADISTLRSFIPVYAASSDHVAQRAVRGIDALATNTGELFMRLARRPDDGQIATAGVEYDAKLRKLIAALHPDYLLDIVRNPHLWDDPQERIAEVERALNAVSDEVVENIKQVNAFRALHFQVSLDGLVGGRKELQDWDRDFRAASGDA